MNDRADLLPEFETDRRLAEVEQRIGPPTPRELTAEDLMAELREIKAMRHVEMQALAAAENAAQVPRPGEESSVVLRRKAVQEQAPASDRELGALVVATLGTVLTALAAATVGYVKDSPEVVLLVVKDLMPWLIGLAGVYIVSRTVVRVVEKRP